MLASFLRRFGKDWDINAQAVAVGEGGIVPRHTLTGADGGPFGGRDKLALKDPLSGGSAWLHGADCCAILCVTVFCLCVTIEAAG